jgi:hypothetical protein
MSVLCGEPFHPFLNLFIYRKMKCKKDKFAEEDNDIVNFYDLWNYLQDSPWLQDDNAFPPEDVVLLHELVAGHNFGAALDLLRHRLKPHRKRLPQELQDILRPAKCIKIRERGAGRPFKTPAEGTCGEGAERPFTLNTPTPLEINCNVNAPAGGFKGACNAPFFITTPLPPTPAELREILKRTRTSSTTTNSDATTTTLQKNVEKDLQEERRRVMEEQDREYMESVMADLQKQQQVNQSQQNWRSAEMDAPIVDGAFRGSKGVVTEGACGTPLSFTPFPLETLTHLETPLGAWGDRMEEEEKVKPLKHWVPDEPLEGDGILVRVRTPTGEILQRRFLATTHFALLQDWLENELGQRLTLATNFPRVEWDPSSFLFDTPIDRFVLNLIGKGH